MKGLGGPGLANWSKRGNVATSPPITLRRGAKNELSVLWQFVNLRLTGREYFRIFAVDNRGGRKLLMTQTIRDIREVGEMAQMYVENIGRYVGPPIRLQFEVSPGLNAVVEDVSF